MPWDEYAYVNMTSGGFFKMFQYANTLTYDFFGVGTLFSFFIILMISFRKFGMDKSFAAASFMTLMFSILLRAGSLIGDVWVILFAIATMVSVLVMKNQ